MKCNQCNAAMINGVFSHESGCPNRGKKWFEDVEEFLTVYTCAECGSEYSNEETLESCCAPAEDEETPLYDVYVRSWWIWEDQKFNGRVKVPGPGEKAYIAHGVTLESARAMCEEYNESHDPGELSIKAEFESQ